MGYQKRYKIEYSGQVVQKPRGRTSNKQYASTKGEIMNKMKNKLNVYPYTRAHLFKLKKSGRGYKTLGTFKRKTSGGKVTKELIRV